MVLEHKDDCLDTGSLKIGDETDVGEVSKVGQVPRLDIMSLFLHQHWGYVADESESWSTRDENARV